MDCVKYQIIGDTVNFVTVQWYLEIQRLIFDHFQLASNAWWKECLQL